MARGGAATQPAAQPYVETVPGSTVTFAMRPVSVPDGSGGARTVWFAETETTWDAYDVFSLRLDENAGNVAAAGAEGPDAVTRPTQPYAPADRGWGHGGYPVISVTFNAATKYCEWLSQKTGRPYRLPRVAEFAIAARKSCQQPSDRPAGTELYWLAHNSEDTTHPVASLHANFVGLHDMFGNVAEWCVGDDGKPVVCGGSFRDSAEEFFAPHAPVMPRRQTSEWTIGSPTFPPSRWWLANAPHVGFRVVCDEPPR